MSELPTEVPTDLAGEVTLEVLADAQDMWDDYWTARNGSGDDIPDFLDALQKRKIRSLAAIAAARSGRGLTETMKLPPTELAVLSGAADPKAGDDDTGVTQVSSPAHGD